MSKRTFIFATSGCAFLLLGQLIFDKDLLSSPQPQHPARVKSFFPLQIGNRWIMIMFGEPGQVYSTSYAVLDTLRIRSMLYYVVDFSGIKYFREDSSGHFYRFSEVDSCETLLMDFSMNAGDSLKLSCLFGREGYTILWDRKTVNTFAGQIGEQLDYQFDYVPGTVDEEQWINLQEGVGPVEHRPVFWDAYYLKGAVIDGQIYGDTSLVSVAEHHHVLPKNFHLQQNYPNPFYASTQIDFEIEQASHVKLEVLNLTGQVVRVLQKGFLLSGNFSAEWEGKDDTGNFLPAGIYFYRLTSENIGQQKKTILLR